MSELTVLLTQSLSFSTNTEDIMFGLTVLLTQSLSFSSNTEEIMSAGTMSEVASTGVSTQSGRKDSSLHYYQKKGRGGPLRRCKGAHVLLGLWTAAWFADMANSHGCVVCMPPPRQQRILPPPRQQQTLTSSPQRRLRKTALCDLCQSGLHNHSRHSL